MKVKLTYIISGPKEEVAYAEQWWPHESSPINYANGAKAELLDRVVLEEDPQPLTKEQALAVAIKALEEISDNPNSSMSSSWRMFRAADALKEIKKDGGPQ